MKANAVTVWAAALGGSWVFVATILRALRAPNDWAEAHWLIGYQQGFLKRALPGTLLSPFVTPANGEALIGTVSAAWLCMFYLSIVWMCCRMLRAPGPTTGRRLLVLVFLTSPYVVMSAHLNGYYDNLLVLCTLAAVLLVTRGRLGAASLVMAAGTLVHENIALVGLPSVLLAATLFLAGREGLRIPSKAMLRRLWPFALPLLSLAAVFIHQTFFLDRAGMGERLTTHLTQFAFVEEGRQSGVPEALVTPFLEYLRSEWGSFPNRLLDKTYLLGTLPSLLVMLFQPGAPFRRGRSGALAIWALVAIALAPLLLHLIAGDTSRIWTYPLIVCLLGLWTASELDPSEGVRGAPGAVFGIVCVAVILHNVFIQTPLMDDRVERFTTSARIWLYLPALMLVLVSSLAEDRGACARSRALSGADLR